MGFVLLTQRGKRLVPNVQPPVASLGQGDVVQLEPELGAQFIHARVLPNIEQVAQLGLRLCHFEVVGTEERIHHAVELSLNRGERLVVGEVLGRGQQARTHVRPRQRAVVVGHTHVRRELLQRIQFGAVTEQLLVHAGHALVCVLGSGDFLGRLSIKPFGGPDADAQLDEHRRGRNGWHRRSGEVELDLGSGHCIDPSGLVRASPNGWV